MKLFKIFSLALLISSSFMPFLQAMEPEQQPKNLLHKVMPQADQNQTLLKYLPKELKKDLGYYIAHPAIKFWQERVTPAFNIEALTGAELRFLMDAYNYYTEKIIWDLSLDDNLYEVFKLLPQNIQKQISSLVWMKLPESASNEIDGEVIEINQRWSNDWDRNKRNLNVRYAIDNYFNKGRVVGIALNILTCISLITNNPTSRPYYTLGKTYGPLGNLCAFGYLSFIIGNSYVIPTYSIALYHYFNNESFKWKNSSETQQNNGDENLNNHQMDR